MDAHALIPLESAPPRGIAQWAADAPELDECKEATYHEIPARSVLNRCRGTRVYFPWTINPYRGCAFGCVYCYARYTHEYLLTDYANRPRDPTYATVPETILDFERRIYVKTGAARVLARELARHDVRGQHIAIGTATDPYQPAERRYRITRSILEVLARFSELSLSITTKSDLVVRDLDLLRRIAARSRLHVNITVTTLDHRIAHQLEPRAPRPDRRLAAVRRLVDAGIEAGVFVMPILPGLTDRGEALDRLFAAAAAAGARYLVAQPLFLRDAARARFYPWLRQADPALFERYRRLFRRDAELAETERGRLRDLVQHLRRKYGLAGDPGRRAHPSPPKVPAEQPALDFDE